MSVQKAAMRAVMNNHELSLKGVLQMTTSVIVRTVIELVVAEIVTPIILPIVKHVGKRLQERLRPTQIVHAHNT